MCASNQYSGMDGRSLENSYTNIFALTDLSGIHYRKYVLKEEKTYDMYEDPILSSYSNCLKQNLMCAWVRTKKEKSEPQKPYLFSNFTRELWVFWYGSGDTVSWESCISPGLERVSDGNWKKGLSYETRCILFKALHNVLERCLLSKGFIRLGLWFLQPCNSLYNRDKVQYSINFSFFLHGESTVCSSLDIRQFPKVKVLNSRIFSLCLKSKQRVSVILSPYGISARLVVPSVGAKEPSNSQLDNWMRFYPIRFDGCDFNPLNFYLGPTGGTGGNDFLTPTKSSPQQPSKNESGTKKSPSSSSSNEKLPKFVDVLLGGYRMRYPACFVLISEEVLESLLSDSGPHNPLTPQPPDSVPPTSEHVSQPLYQSLEPDVLGRFSNLPNSSKASGHPRLPLAKLPSARRRRHLADRALRRALRSELSFINSTSHPERLLENYLNYSHLPGLRLSRSFTPSSSTEHGLCEPNGRIGPTPQPSCSPSALPSSSVPTFPPLHRRAFNVSHATHSFLDELDCYCDKTRSPLLTNTDPMMPTLSPQQPAPGHQTGHHSVQVATVTTTATTNVLSDSSVFTPPSSFVTQPPGSRGNSVPTSLPPCLLNPAAAFVRESPTLKPDEVERGSTGKPPPCLAKISPPRSVPALPSGPGSAPIDDGATFPPPRPLYNSWLVEQTARAIQRGSCATHKQPLISLSLVDKMNILDNSLPVLSDPHVPGLIKAPSDGIIRLLKPGSHEQATDAYAFKSEDPDMPGHYYPYASNPSSVLSTYDSGSIDGYPGSEEHLRELDEDYLKPETASQILIRTRARRLPPGRSLFSSSGSGHLDPSELALMFPTPPSHDTHQPSPTDISMLVAASAALSVPGFTNSNPCTPTASATASQTADINKTALASPCDSASTVSMEAVGQVFPHLTKFLFDQSGLDAASAQDWAFLRPAAPHFHIPSMYKLSMEEFLIYRESLPHSQLTYDHRSLSSDQLNTFNLPPSTTSVPSATTLSQNVAASPVKSHGSRVAACEPLDPLRPVGSVLKAQPAYALEVSETREADPLKLVLILSDSLLSLFKDHNFDSCNICECTSSVFGSEMEIYLPNPRPPQSVPPESATALRTPLSAAPWSAFSLEDQLSLTFFSSASRSCTCGFSALVNRRYAMSGNLFYEDQLEVSALSIARFFLADRVQITEPPCPRLPPPPPLAQPSAYSRNDGWWAGRAGPNATHMALLHQWTCGSLEEFGVRLLVDWLNHDDLTATSTSKENLFDYTDACALAASAIEQSVLDPQSLDSSMEVDRMSSEDLPLDEATREEGIAFHPAFFHRASAEIPANKNDQIRLLESVRPWLQEAISSTRLLESNYKVDGPLTWKAFHQLAGRGANESCKPQPIPPFLVGGPDKDSLLISPFGVRDWDCLALAPLSRPKRVAFAVVLPALFAGPFGNAGSGGGGGGGGGGATSANESPVSAYTSPRPSPLPTAAPMSTLANFFRELSYAYENCRLGQHYPYFNPVAGSPETSFILVCSPQDETDPDIATVTSLAPLSADLRRRLLRRLQTHTPSPEHFLQHLQFYVATAIHTTVKLLAERGVALPDGRRSCLVFPTFSSSASFAAAAAAPAEGVQQSKLRNTVAAMSAAPRSPMPIASKTNPASGEGPLTTAYEGPPVDSDINTSLLIYLVNPFTQFADMDEEFQRLTTQALVGAGTRILSLLPDSWRQRVSFQLLPMEHMTSDYLPRLKSMALSVYSFVDRFIEPSLINANRTLTGMGPAAEKEVISATGEHLHARRVYSPAYTLAQRPDLWGQWGLHPSEPLENSSVLFVSYCLSEDQQWLLAACTDEQGSMLEHTFINIKMPESMRSGPPQPPTPATASAAASEAANSTHLSSRRLGLACLWDFIISILATTSNPWRLVIGRLGRLGHGELKGWSGLLSSKNLQDVNQSLRANCSLCATATSVSTTSARHMYNGKTTTTISLVAGGGVNSCVHEIPSVLSACLVSIEPQSTFRLFPFSDLHMGESWLSSGGGGGAGGFGAPGSSSSGAGGGGVGGGGGGNAGAAYGAAGMCPFNSGFVSASGYAPSTTHILVFPTSPSARAQSEHDDFSRLTELNLTDDLLDYSNGLLYSGLDDQAMNQCTNLSILDLPDPGERNSSVVQLRADSATIAEPDTTGLSYDAACRVLAKHYLSHALLPFGVPDPQLEQPSLMQQPLAMGYYISTAPTGPMPAWFWSACRQTSQSNPVCLKSALHLHLTLVGNDDAVTTDTAVSPGVAGGSDGSRGYAGHLLDSTVTCDVLRFVLESYNSLSWLTYDPVTNDRRSCLPFHILALAQLSQATRIFT